LETYKLILPRVSYEKNNVRCSYRGQRFICRYCQSRFLLADAYTVYWINAWLGSRGRNDDLPPAQFLAVRNQVAAVLLSSPELIAASNAQKQEFAEGLLFQAALISATVESVQSNPEQMAQVQTSILQGTQGLGLALNQMTLTAEGFQLDR
jgi:hypothetical protein